MEGVYQETRKQLNNPEMNFTLLLPADEVSLEKRVGAVADWCDGFLYGLALVGINVETNLPRTSAEFIIDITEITKAWIGKDYDEQDEVAYAEIVEYLRMGVLLFAEELQCQNVIVGRNEQYALVFNTYS